jgi:hypothetical protein
MHAPEEHGAKWWMFASILCILVGPSLNVAAPFSSSSTRTAYSNSKSAEVAALTNEIEAYKKFQEAHEVSSYLKMAGSMASLLSTVFFVLFLRAVAQCLGNESQMRWCEWYLLLNGVLVGVFLTMFLGIGITGEAVIVLLMALAAGQVLALVLYVFLIITTSVIISTHLGRIRG